MAADRADKGASFDAQLLFLMLGIGALLSTLAAGFTEDMKFRFHAYILMAASLAGLVVMTLGVNSGRFRAKLSGYEDDVIKAGVIATMFWGAVGMLVGVIIACQLSWPNLFYFPEAGWLNFGRLRPLHTSGVIFAFGGNALICTSFWVVQRTSRARLFGGVLPWFVFWGYQLFIVLAATGYVAGITQSREYAEPEW